MEARLENHRGAQFTNSMDRMMTVSEPVSSPLHGCSVTENSLISYTKVQEHLNPRNKS